MDLKENKPHFLLKYKIGDRVTYKIGSILHFATVFDVDKHSKYCYLIKFDNKTLKWVKNNDIVSVDKQVD